MSKHNKKSLVRQVQEALDARLAIGESKHDAKKKSDDPMHLEGVYSWGTYKSYLKIGCSFVSYCKEKYGCKTLEACEAHASEWLSSRSDAGLSAYTLKLDRCALGKIYGRSSDSFSAPIEKRTYAAVTRSRGPAARDKHFSEAKNGDLLEFARSTGLRRGELQQLRGDALVQKRGQYYIRVTTNTKGGRNRLAPICGDTALVVRLMTAAGEEKVFPHVHGALDVHACRRVYAQRLYDTVKRPLDVCEADRSFVQPGRLFPDRDAVYRRRGEFRGTWLDKRAMVIVSRALGHNRLSVVGEHYLK